MSLLWVASWSGHLQLHIDLETTSNSPIIVEVKHLKCNRKTWFRNAEQGDKEDVPKRWTWKGLSKNTSFRNRICDATWLMLKRFTRPANSTETIDYYSEKEISPSLLVSKSMKNLEGAQCNSLGTVSPLRNPSLTRFDSDGGNSGTTARIKSAGVRRTSPSGVLKDAKYSKTWKENKWNITHKKA